MAEQEPVQRLNYFNGQFLREKDFKDEQTYHLRRRRMHNRLLHTWGVAEGLELSFAAGAHRLTIRPGVAIDVQGREIVLREDHQTEDLSSFAGGPPAFVSIEYDEQPNHETSEAGVTGKTRYTEEPKIEVAKDAPHDPSVKLILGRVTIASNGVITGTDEGAEPNHRRAAGVVGGDLVASALTIKPAGAAGDTWPRLTAEPGTNSAPTQLKLSGGVLSGDNVSDTSVSLKKLRRKILNSGTGNVNAKQTLEQFTREINVNQPMMPVVLVQAYSTTDGAVVGWSEKVVTSVVTSSTIAKHYVVFENRSDKPINLLWNITELE